MPAALASDQLIAAYQTRLPSRIPRTWYEMIAPWGSAEVGFRCVDSVSTIPRGERDDHPTHRQSKYRGSPRVQVTSSVERPICRPARRLCETRNRARAHRTLRRRDANPGRTGRLRVVVFRFPPARRLVVGDCFLHQGTAEPD